MDQAHYSNRSLSRKLTTYVVLSSTLVTSVAIGLMLFRQYESDIDKLNQRLDSIKLSALPSIEKSLWEFNDLQVQTLIDSLMNLDDVISVEVHGFTWDNKPKVISAKGSQAASSNILEKTFPIVSQMENRQSQLGELQVVASLENVHSNLWKQAQFIIITQGIKTLIITTFILLLIQSLLSRHLHSISNHARSLKLYRGFTPLSLKRKKPSEPDELDEVVDTLNQMQLSLIEEQRRELRLEKERAFADANAQAKSEFLSHMSHEIRTPLNGVIGLLDLMDGDNLTEEQKKYLNLIKKSGQGLLLIINDILDLSKIEANKLKLNKSAFFIEDLVYECTAIYTASCREKNIHVVENIDPGFKKQLIGDPLRIKQILLNLLSNAVKHTESGEILLSVRRETNEQKQLLVTFSVKDTGTGIEENNQQRIFEAFEQGDIPSASTGTGLGLSICKKLCDLMNGEIGLQSTYGEGSEFWFSIPLAESLTDASHELDNPEIDNEPVDFSNLHKKGVLVVEDNDINQQVIDSLLKKLGIEAAIVANGKEACDFKAAHGDTFPVILMDCEMPVMDGFEASRIIRQREEEGHKNIIISLSAYLDPVHQEKCEAAGMDYLISKPVTLYDLKRTLKKVQQQLEPQ